MASAADDAAAREKEAIQIALMRVRIHRDLPLLIIRRLSLTFAFLSQADLGIERYEEVVLDGPSNGVSHDNNPLARDHYNSESNNEAAPPDSLFRGNSKWAGQSTHLYMFLFSSKTFINFPPRGLSFWAAES